MNHEEKIKQLQNEAIKHFLNGDLSLMRDCLDEIERIKTPSKIADNN